MDFFPWGHTKALIYTSPVDSEEEFIARIVDAAVTIRQQPGIFEHTHQSAALSAYIHCAYRAYILLQVCMSMSDIVIHNIE
jgi:hypothetical protein